MLPIDEFRAERGRQIDHEGWTAEHDDSHRHGELLRAAVLYRQYGRGDYLADRGDGAPYDWPWSAESWKPGSRRRALVKSGALCLAELNRLQRADMSCNHAHYHTGRSIAALAMYDEARGILCFRQLLHRIRRPFKILIDRARH